MLTTLMSMQEKARCSTPPCHIDATFHTNCNNDGDDNDTNCGLTVGKNPHWLAANSIGGGQTWRLLNFVAFWSAELSGWHILMMWQCHWALLVSFVVRFQWLTALNL